MSQLASLYRRAVSNRATNYTFTAADSGVVQNVTATATITLPTSVAGMVVIVRNGGQGATDGLVTVNVSPQATDQIRGLGFTAANDKDAINTLGRPGDEIALIGGPANTWQVLYAHGTWTREA